MTDLVEALRLEGDRRVSEKEMAFGNGKSREDRIADDLCYQAASRISQQDAELERLKAVIAWANNSLFGSHGFFLSLDGGEPDEHHLDRSIEDLKARNRAHFAQLAEARKAAFIEAAEIAETLGVYPELNVFAGGPEWYKHGKAIAKVIRAKAEGQP